MVKKEWQWMYFNDEWNETSTDSDGGDEDHEDFVDTYYSPSDYKKNTHEYDDYEEYGN
jgi:hypothetical protein